MTKLRQTTCVAVAVALYELEWTSRQRLILLTREHAGERLLAEVEKGDQLCVATDST